MELPSPAGLFALVIFGITGFAAFRYGKKNGRLSPMLLGLVLMLYPYFISQTWAIYAVGCGLCAGLYLLRD